MRIETGDATPFVRCLRCGRTLRSAASIARSRGRTCERRERQEKAAAGFKAATVAKARELIEQGGVVPLRGRVCRTVSSDGERTYLTAPEACNCPAYLKARFVCFHRVAVILAAA